jgi:hypothetical protein
MEMGDAGRREEIRDEEMEMDMEMGQTNKESYDQAVLCLRYAAMAVSYAKPCPNPSWIAKSGERVWLAGSWGGTQNSSTIGI